MWKIAREKQRKCFAGYGSLLSDETRLGLSNEITNTSAKQWPVAFGSGESSDSSDTCCSKGFSYGVNCSSTWA